MKRKLSVGDAQDAFSGFPVVLGTVHGEKDNVITLALCHAFSFSPPLMGVGIAPERHSFGLFKQSKDFAVNIPDASMLRAVKVCGAKSGRDVDKFEVAGLTKEKAEVVSAPLIAECPVNIECVKTHEVETGDHVWFVGEIVAARQKEDYDPKEMLFYWGEYRTIGELVK